jgi:CTP:molybdopterin cytidylyltransferase MocA
MVINTGLKSSLEAQVHNFPDGELVLNSEPARGQLHSLCLGLQAAAAGDAVGALVALVDQPAIQPATFAAIAAAATAHPAKIILPAYGGQTGHPIVIPRGAFEAFISAPPGQTARDVIKGLADMTQTIEVSDGNILKDIDSPEDLAKATKPASDDDEID